MGVLVRAAMWLLLAAPSCNTDRTAPKPPPAAASASADADAPREAPELRPILAPARRWSWVPFEDAFCADGSNAGVGVNMGSPDGIVVIYLEGGGACWSEFTCFALDTANHLASGYAAVTFAAEAADPNGFAAAGGFFDRSAGNNPFKDASYVYVPYCTGDAHAGNNVVTYGMHTVKHVGFANFSAYLRRLVPTFGGRRRVVLAGSSAGGFGALVNWWQTQRAFGALQVDLIADSAVALPRGVLDDRGLEVASAQQVAWNLRATVPPGCASCAADLSLLYDFYGTTFPGHRAALLASVEDSVLPAFYGIREAEFEAGLAEVTAQVGAMALYRTYEILGETHGLWSRPDLATRGVTVRQFVTRMVTDDPTWKSVQP